MSEKEHSKIINKVATQILKPAGLERKGQSRIWYDDRGWFTTMVEFQPHKWEHGAYLNVGASFHWYEQDYLSFDMGYRETGFEKFQTASQFSARIQAMVELALQKALENREKLGDLKSASESIVAHTFTSDSLWGNYHRAVACALSGDPDCTMGYFHALLAVDHDVPWANELKDRARELVAMAASTEALKAHLSAVVNKTRELKKLKPVEFRF